MMQQSLFQDDSCHLPLAEGAVYLGGFCRDKCGDLLIAIHEIELTAPFRHMVTPGGLKMSVAMTNCGTYGWVSDQLGYRYTKHDPNNNQLWPALPSIFYDLAQAAAQQAGYPHFTPDACLINRYAVGCKMSLHQDKNEIDISAPIVSISIGIPAVFQFGGMTRTDKKRNITLSSGDIVVWGGPSRLAFHGILPLKDNTDPLTGKYRYNITFRKAY